MNCWIITLPVFSNVTDNYMIWASNHSFETLELHLSDVYLTVKVCLVDCLKADAYYNIEIRPDLQSRPAGFSNKGSICACIQYEGNNKSTIY